MIPDSGLNPERGHILAFVPVSQKRDVFPENMVEKEFEKDFFSYRSGYPRTFGMYAQSMTWGRHLESSWNYASDRLDLTVVVLAY